MNETIDELHQQNGTDYDNPWKSQDYLSTYQIIVFIWSIVCLIPNCILIYLLMRKTRQQSHLHITVGHWSVCNVVLILSTILWTVVPLTYFSYKIWEPTCLFTMSFITLTSVLVTIFTTYMKPESGQAKRCIFGFWVLVGVLMSLSVVSAFLEYIRVVLMLVSAGFISTICLIVLIVKITLWCRNRTSTSEDDSYQVRLAIATIYVTIPFVYMCLFVSGYHWAILCELLKLIIFADGFVNLGFLLHFDKTTKNAFMILLKIKTAEQST